MLFMSPVRKIEPRHIHPGLNQGFQDLRGLTRWTDGTNNLRLTSLLFRHWELTSLSPTKRQPPLPTGGSLRSSKSTGKKWPVCLENHRPSKISPGAGCTNQIDVLPPPKRDW